VSLYELVQPIGDSLVPERRVVAVVVENRLVRLAMQIPEQRKKIEHRDVEVIGDPLQPLLRMIVNEIGLDLHANRERDDQQLEAVLRGPDGNRELADEQTKALEPGANQPLSGVNRTGIDLIPSMK